MYRIPWSVVLMMLNDLTKEKKKKEPGTVESERYDLITSDEEAYTYFNL